MSHPTNALDEMSDVEMDVAGHELPLLLVLVRHGMTTLNERNRAMRAKSAQPHLFIPRQDPSAELNERGREQSAIAGDWLSVHVPYFSHYLTSWYMRCWQSNEYFAPEAPWQETALLAERQTENVKLQPDTKERRRLLHRYNQECHHDSYHAVPPFGISTAQHVQKLKREFLPMLHELARADKHATVLCSTHAGPMYSLRQILEGLSPAEYHRREQNPHPFTRMHNAQVIEYSRCNPSDSEYVLPYFGWTRSVVPWDMTLSTNAWTVIPEEIGYRIFEP